MEIDKNLTKEQRSSSRKNNREAWKHFYPEGNGKAKPGCLLHHKDPSWKTNDIERYLQWNIDDLMMLTVKEHNLIHKTHEIMRHNSDEAHRGAHHYFNKITHEQKMFKQDPSDEWEKGLYFDNDGRSILLSHQIKDKNGMFMKSMYDGKSKEELDSIRDKKQSTFYAKTKEERDAINGRRGHGTPVFCITTNEWFKSANDASKAYEEYGCSKVHKVYKGECFAGMKDGVRLKWRLATKEENDLHKEDVR